MLAELRNDNELPAVFMREAHFVCGGVDDLASMSMLENCIDEAERRVGSCLNADAGNELR